MNDRLRDGREDPLVVGLAPLRSYRESSVLLRCGGGGLIALGRTVTVVVEPLDLDLCGFGGGVDERSPPASDGTKGLAYCRSCAFVWDTQLEMRSCVRTYFSYASGE